MDGKTGLMGRALRGSALTAGSFVITQGCGWPRT